MAKVPYLPIGSVVLLKNSDKRVMIYGRIVRSNDDETVYDYVGCPYPEGAMASNDILLFDHEQIRMVYFIGFQDLEEIALRQILARDRDKLKEKEASQEKEEEKAEEEVEKEPQTEEEVNTDE